MKCIWFELEDGSVVQEWIDIGDRKIKSIKIDVVSLGNLSSPPLIEFKNYDKYMFQKYGVYGVGLTGNKTTSISLAGFQVGGYINGKGWVILDVSILNRIMTITFVESITSIAIKEGVK